VYRYARRVDGAWQFFDIAERDNVYAQDLALAITPDDQVFLAFPELGSGGLMVMHSVR
jgi:hypothetical protein